MNREELIAEIKSKFNLRLAKKDEQTIFEIVEKYAESRVSESRTENEKLKADLDYVCGVKGIF